MRLYFIYRIFQADTFIHHQRSTRISFVFPLAYSHTILIIILSIELNKRRGENIHNTSVCFRSFYTYQKKISKWEWLNENVLMRVYCFVSSIFWSEIQTRLNIVAVQIDFTGKRVYMLRSHDVERMKLNASGRPKFHLYGNQRFCVFR